MSYDSVVIVGDFNFDSLTNESTKLTSFMSENGFKQEVKLTTRENKILDHIYCNFFDLVYDIN